MQLLTFYHKSKHAGTTESNIYYRGYTIWQIFNTTAFQHKVPRIYPSYRRYGKSNPFLIYPSYRRYGKSNPFLHFSKLLLGGLLEEL
jgi:hypothetical protein